MTFRRSAGAILAAAVLALGLTAGSAATVRAHVVQQFGPYSVAIGWLHEPTYIGVENAVQVIVKDAAGKSVDDISPDDFHVTVTAGGQTSQSLPLNASFDPDTGLGTPGEYTAHLIPTFVGDYTFHLKGTIHGQLVDASFTSSDKTFDSVRDATEVEFPAKLPALGELATRLDRVDQRASAGASVAARASASASQAQASADRALAVGVVVGGLGFLFGLAGLLVALRVRRRQQV